MRTAIIPARPLVGAFCAFVLALTGCGGSDGGGSPTTPPPETGDLSPVLGTWSADSIVVSPKANPAVSREIVSEDGVRFTFRVQSSGAYEATLQAFGQSSRETGTLRIQGNTLFFTAQTPVAGSSRGSFVREGNRLIMLGDLMLDFNQDGIADDLNTRFVLTPP